MQAGAPASAALCSEESPWSNRLLAPSCPLFARKFSDATADAVRSLFSAFLLPTECSNLCTIECGNSRKIALLCRSTPVAVSNKLFGHQVKRWAMLIMVILSHACCPEHMGGKESVCMCLTGLFSEEFFAWNRCWGY